jgi:DNA polymerase-3 subunit epsilon
MEQSKPIVFFDLETTGLNQKTDRIVEICMIKENPDGTSEELYSRFNPFPVEVSPEAEMVHGMSNADLMNEPEFSEKAQDILDFIEGCDIGGYNILYFDIPMLFEELYRCGKPHDFKKHTIYDSYKIWTVSESRTLTGAVKRYLGEDHKHAHSAKGDVEVTARILKKQIQEYRDQYASAQEMALVSSEMGKKVDFAGKFGRNDDNQVVITFGKHKDKPVQQVYMEDPGYIQWMYEKADFPTETKLIARNIHAKLESSKANA